MRVLGHLAAFEYYLLSVYCSKAILLHHVDVEERLQSSA